MTKKKDPLASGVAELKSVTPKAPPGRPVDKKSRAAVDAAMALLEKQFGKGSVMRMGTMEIPELEVIPTGSYQLDSALGVGGYPRGRMVEIYGPESSGKTTLALHAAANAQKQGLVVAFVDAEHALDVGYAKKIGVDTDELILSQPDYGEQALEVVETLTRSGGIGLIIVDSVAALVPKSEIEGDMGDSHVGLQARLMSQACRKLTSIVSSTDTTLLWLNQLRMKIGVMFGNPEVTTGGNALKFYSSVRLDIRRIGALKEKEAVIGNKTRVKVVKNKVAPPFQQREFDIRYNVGIDSCAELLDMAVDDLVIAKKGAWFSYGEELIGQGRLNAVDFLRKHDAMRQTIEKELGL